VKRTAVFLKFLPSGFGIKKQSRFILNANANAAVKVSWNIPARRVVLNISKRRGETLPAIKELKLMLDRISLILVIIGAINWGSIGLFKFDIVAWIFGGQGAIVSRIIYTIVGLAGIWCLSLLFRENEVLETGKEDMQ